MECVLKAVCGVPSLPSLQALCYPNSRKSLFSQSFHHQPDLYLAPVAVFGAVT